MNVLQQCFGCEPLCTCLYEYLEKIFDKATKVEEEARRPDLTEIAGPGRATVDDVHQGAPVARLPKAIFVLMGQDKAWSEQTHGGSTIATNFSGMTHRMTSAQGERTGVMRQIDAHHGQWIAAPVRERQDKLMEEMALSVTQLTSPLLCLEQDRRQNWGCHEPKER